MLSAILSGQVRRPESEAEEEVVAEEVVAEEEVVVAAEEATTRHVCRILIARLVSHV